MTAFHHLLIKLKGFSLQLCFHALIKLCSEKLPENPGLFPGRRHQKPCKFSLCDHGKLLKLTQIQPQKLLDKPGDLAASLKRSPVCAGDPCFFPFLRKPLCSFAGTKVFRVPVDLVTLFPMAHHKLHIGRRFGIRKITAHTVFFPHLTTHAAIKRIGNGIKNGGFPCAGRPCDQKKPSFFKSCKIDLLFSLIRPPATDRQPDGFHKQSSNSRMMSVTAFFPSAKSVSSVTSS